MTDSSDQRYVFWSGTGWWVYRRTDGVWPAVPDDGPARWIGPDDGDAPPAGRPGEVWDRDTERWLQVVGKVSAPHVHGCRLSPDHKGACLTDTPQKFGPDGCEHCHG